MTTEQLDRIAKSLQEVQKAFYELAKLTIEALHSFAFAMEKYEQNRMIETSLCSGRVKHLARYAKKRRVRKKNLNRIRKKSPSLRRGI